MTTSKNIKQTAIEISKDIMIVNGLDIPSEDQLSATFNKVVSVSQGYLLNESISLEKRLCCIDEVGSAVTNDFVGIGNCAISILSSLFSSFGFEKETSNLWSSNLSVLERAYVLIEFGKE